MADMTLAASAAETGDVQTALDQAKIDSAKLKTTWEASITAQGAAQDEQRRCAGVQMTLNNKIAELNPQLKEAQRRAFQFVCDGANIAKEQRKDALRLREEREFASSCLSYCVAYPLNDAVRGVLEADLNERVAYARFQEARATRARLKLMAGAQTLLLADPNAKIDTTDSWSTLVMQEVDRVNNIDVPRLRQAIVDHDAQVERERALVGLF